MLDTVRLEIPQHMYTILDHSLFNPPTYEMFNQGAFSKGSLTRSVQNPSAQDRKLKIYKPRLTVVRRPLKGLGYQNTLYVEASLPKIVFCNNFDELTEPDFDQTLNLLSEKLKTMGVYTIRSNLPQAKVSAIHFGKNIVLTDHTTPFTYIRELKKIDTNKIYDVNQTDYKNGGLSYKLHSNLFEYTFYDKLKEIERSKISSKRAVKQDDHCQLSLLDLIVEKQSSENPFQVIRVEMRLNNRTKLKQMLRRFGFSENCSLASLFSRNLAQNLLQGYFNQMFENYIPTYDLVGLDLLTAIKMHNPSLKEKNLLELCLAHQVINESGVRAFRNIISDQTWYRLKRQLKNLNVPHARNALLKIEKALHEFEAVRLIDYPQLMINNDKNETY